MDSNFSLCNLQQCLTTSTHHGQVFKDLDPVSWSHVGHMVEVGGVGDQLVPHLWISQHLSGDTNKDAQQLSVKY